LYFEDVHELRGATNSFKVFIDEAVEQSFARIPNLQEMVAEEQKRTLSVKSPAEYVAEDIYGMIRYLETSWKYIVSFSIPYGLRQFRDGSLDMWRWYGSMGGYALEFDRKNVFDYIGDLKRTYPLFEYESVEAANVEYELIKPTQTEIDSLVANIYHRYSGKEPTNDDWESYLVEAIVRRQSFSKSAHFVNEQEFRIVIRLSSSFDINEHKYCDYTVKGGSFAPVIFLPGFLEKCLVGAIVGPHPNAENRKLGLEHFLASQGLADLNIRCSTIDIADI
jgi:hypothetical protein